MDSNMEYSDNACEEYGDNNNSVDDNAKRTDPEYFEFDCLTVKDVEKLLNESVERLNTILQITPSLARMLLVENQWNYQIVVDKYRHDASAVLVAAHIMPPPESDSAGAKMLANNNNAPTLIKLGGSCVCLVCGNSPLSDNLYSLSCGHSFCKDCWLVFIEIQIIQGTSTKICCMSQMCNVRVPEDLVKTLVTRPFMRKKYEEFAFEEYVKSHRELRFCPGPNCRIIVQSAELSAKRAICKACHTCFCFKCGMDYHAPTDCQAIKKWLTLCTDVKGTASFINTDTKDCPKCHTCIEKDGGCHHMQCFNCKHVFCWLCSGDWETHGFECTRKKDNPSMANESMNVQAREAYDKYMHYHERWENHAKSLQLEKQTFDRLRQRVNEKVMNGHGKWIDWQCLFNSAALLAKCRYTLQYTYPLAYFMDEGSRKELLENQQKQLEAAIENLSWKIERAEMTDLVELENQMDIAEKGRIMLLKDFFTVDI